MYFSDYPDSPVLPPSPFRSAALLEYKRDLQVKVYPIPRQLSHPRRVVRPRVGRTMPGSMRHPLVSSLLSLEINALGALR